MQRRVSDVPREAPAAKDPKTNPKWREATKHEELRARLSQLIDSGMPPHEPLPSERELMERFGVSRMTVRHALADLVQRGRVYRVHGAGTFVAEPIVRKEMTLTSFSEDMAARGLLASSLLLAVRTEPAGAVVGQALQVSPVDAVIHLNRLRLANDEPMCLEETYLPLAIVGNIAAELDETTSLYERLRTSAGIRIVRAEQELKPTVLSAEEAELLGVPPLSPALHMTRVTYDDRGRRIEYAKSLYRGDRYSIEVNLCLA